MTRTVYIPDDVAKKVEQSVKGDLTFNKIITNALIQYFGLDRPKSVDERLDELFEFKEQIEEFKDRVAQLMRAQGVEL